MPVAFFALFEEFRQGVASAGVHPLNVCGASVSGAIVKSPCRFKVWSFDTDPFNRVFARFNDGCVRWPRPSGREAGSAYFSNVVPRVKERWHVCGCAGAIGWKHALRGNDPVPRFQPVLGRRANKLDDSLDECNRHHDDDDANACQQDP